MYKNKYTHTADKQTCTYTQHTNRQTIQNIQHAHIQTHNKQHYFLEDLRRLTRFGDGVEVGAGAARLRGPIVGLGLAPNCNKNLRPKGN